MTPAGEHPGHEIPGRVLHPGSASGEMLCLDDLSFWGGVDTAGTVIDVHHPAHGTSLTGKVLVMSSSKGSSSGSSVLAELIVNGCAPAGMILANSDAIVVSGCLAAAEISGRSLPVVEVSEAELERIRALGLRSAGTGPGGSAAVVELAAEGMLIGEPATLRLIVPDKAGPGLSEQA